MEFGMSDKLGPMQYGRPGGEVFLGRDYARQQDYSDEVAAFIDEEVRRMINAAHEEARVVISEHRDAMERMVAILLEKETVGPDEVAEIFKDVPKWEHDAEGSLRIRLPADRAAASTPDVAAAVANEDGEPPAKGSKPRKRSSLPRLKPADAPGS
jgi:cell division protease FtsH